MFNQLDSDNARRQFALLGGLPARVIRADGSSADTTAIVDRNVEAVSDNGLATTRRTLISLLRADAGTMRRGQRVIVNPDDANQTERFEIADPLDDDGVVTRGFARG